jgi:hypothetical protein
LFAFRWKFAVVSLSVLSALLTGFTPVTAAESEHPLTIHFMKDCPASTCTGVLVRENGKVIANSSDSFSATSGQGFPVIHITAVEAVSSRHGSLNLQLSGTIDCSAAPTTVITAGTVVSGRWNGEDMTGSSVHEVGHRVTSDPCSNNPALSHTFVGTLWVRSESED